MDKKALRVAIAGCGDVALRWHLPAWQKIRGVEIVAVCDVNEATSQKTADRFHINHAYTNFLGLLQKERLNLVDICTPPASHLSLCIAALEAGCHVLIEKPMAVNCDEADKMIQAARQNRVKLCVAHNKLFQPMMMKAISRVNSGEIGDLIGLDLRDGRTADSLHLVSRNHWCHQLSGGVFGEDLPHPIYLASKFLGDLEPVAVLTRKLGGPEWLVADEVRIILEGKKGIATLTASCNWPKVAATVDIFGTRRQLHVDVHSSLLIEYGAGGVTRLRRAWDNVSQGCQYLACTFSAGLNTLLGRHLSGHDTLIRQLVKAIQQDTQPPVTGEEGREVVRLLEKITRQLPSVEKKEIRRE